MSIETRLMKHLEELPPSPLRNDVKEAVNVIIAKDLSLFEKDKDIQNLLDENERLNIDLIVAKAND
jgi:hypothetical protein